MDQHIPVPLACASEAIERQDLAGVPVTAQRLLNRPRCAREHAEAGAR